MNGIHDLGGMQDFGPVTPEAHEPAFHHEWEKAVFVMMLVARAFSTIDAVRWAIEQIPPLDYLGSSYYQRWLLALEKALLDKGVLSRAELEARRAALLAQPAGASPRRELPERTAYFLDRLRQRYSFIRPGPAPCFQPGTRVRARNLNPSTHTRLPRYVRGKQGTIELVHGVFVFPDTNALGQGENPQPLYSVRFAARELWGDNAEPKASVNIDLWESYLLPA